MEPGTDFFKTVFRGPMFCIRVNRYFSANFVKLRPDGIVMGEMIMSAKNTETSNKNHGHGYCPHLTFRKEFVRGAPTGNYICRHCGRHLTVILTAAKT